jgi:glycosyltransferase involved in cell wall biosynthesis
MKLAVVILPCLNEENTVKNTIKQIKKHLKNVIIIVVDDASTDNSIKKLQGANKVILLKQRISLANLIKIGLEHAKHYYPDYIIHIDSDGQHNPKYLPKMIETLNQKNADMIIGTRSLNQIPLLKRFGNIFFTGLIHLITGYELNDTQSGLRVMKYNFAEKLNLSSNFTYTHEEIIVAKKLNKKIIEMPIIVNKRQYQKSRIARNPIKYGLLALIDIVRVTLKKLSKFQ